MTKISKAIIITFASAITCAIHVKFGFTFWTGVAVGIPTIALVIYEVIENRKKSQ